MSDSRVVGIAPPRRSEFQPTASHELNPFAGDRPVVTQQIGALANAEQQRAVAEIQARMIIARSNPRDPIKCMDQILSDCTRPSLAQRAIYQYSRGGSDISGPSIRLAETIAQRWGNIASGIKEVFRSGGYSECIAYAWDMETGYYDDRQFQVKHWRDTKKGGYQLTDERDIYELIANVGQRRKRAVLLTVLPGDVVEAATEQCERTLKASADTSPEAMRRIVAAFEEFGVTQAQIEKRFQRRLDSIRPAQVVLMRKIYASLKDEMSVPGDWFEQTAWTDLAEKSRAGQSAGGAATDEKADQTGSSEQKKAEEPAGQAVDQSGTAKGEPKNEASTFEAWICDENGDATDPEPVRDPVKYAHEIERLWQASHNREALLENNSDGLGDAATASDEASKIIVSMKGDAAEPINFAPIVVPEGGRNTWQTFVELLSNGVKNVPPARLEEWATIQGPGITRAPQPFRVRISRAIVAYAQANGVAVPAVITSALGGTRARQDAEPAAEQAKPEATAPTATEGQAAAAEPTSDQRAEQGEPESKREEPDPEADKLRAADEASEQFVQTFIADLNTAVSESIAKGSKDPIVKALSNRAIQSKIAGLKVKERYAAKHARVIGACMSDPVLNAINELQHAYPVFYDDVMARATQG